MKRNSLPQTSYKNGKPNAESIRPCGALVRGLFSTTDWSSPRRRFPWQDVDQSLAGTVQGFDLILPRPARALWSRLAGGWRGCRNFPASIAITLRRWTFPLTTLDLCHEFP